MWKSWDDSAPGYLHSLLIHCLRHGFARLAEECHRQKDHGGWDARVQGAKRGMISIPSRIAEEKGCPIFLDEDRWANDHQRLALLDKSEVLTDAGSFTYSLAMHWLADISGESELTVLKHDLAAQNHTEIAATVRCILHSCRVGMSSGDEQAVQLKETLVSFEDVVIAILCDNEDASRVALNGRSRCLSGGPLVVQPGFASCVRMDSYAVRSWVLSGLGAACSVLSRMPQCCMPSCFCSLVEHFHQRLGGLSSANR